MNLLAIHVCKRLRYNLCNSTYHAIRQYSNIPDNVSDNVQKSFKFPDYKIIYTFPHVIFPYFINKMKRYVTIGSGTVISVTAICGISNIIPIVDSSIIVCAFCFVTGLFHGTSYWCNNFVGSIYFKEDNQKVIISYINYWGKRIDLKRNISDIMPLTESPSIRGIQMYKYLMIDNYDQKLKLYLKSGNIHSGSDFLKVFGSAH